MSLSDLLERLKRATREHVVKVLLHSRLCVTLQPRRCKDCGREVRHICVRSHRRGVTLYTCLDCYISRYPEDVLDVLYAVLVKLSRSGAYSRSLKDLTRLVCEDSEVLCRLLSEVLSGEKTCSQ